MGLMVNISEPRLRKQIRSMLREGAIGYEPLGSDSAWNLQYDICKQVSVLLRKKLASKDAQDAYDAIGVVTKLLKLGLGDRYSSLLANDTKLQDAVKKAFERLRNDHDWIKQWDDEHEITHAVKCTEVEYDEIMGAYHGRGQARDAAYKRLFESDSDYEPLNSDSAFDFQSEVFDAALDLIKERLLDKRGQNAYDGIGAMNYFLEKNLGNCPLFLEDEGGKEYDEAVKQAFKTVRADKEWINSWKDPDMLLAAIDSAEKKYEDLKGMYLVLYKKTGDKVKLDENQLSNIVVEVVTRLMAESFNHWNSPKVVDLIRQHGIQGRGCLYSNYLLTLLRDDDIVGVSDHYVEEPGKDIYSVSISDDKYIVFTTKSNKQLKELIYGNTRAKDAVRPNNEFADDFVSAAYGDNLSQSKYIPMTTRGRDARDLRTNPYFRMGKRRPYNPFDNLKDAEWNEKTTRDTMDNLRRGKDRYGNDNRPRF